MTLGNLHWRADRIISPIVRFIGNQHKYLELGGIVVVLFLIYNATLSVNLWASPDSLQYLEDIEASTTPWQFHPHHLLYAVSGIAFWQLWQLFGYTGDALLPLQELNIIFACLSVAVIYLLLRQIVNSRRKSLLVCLAVAFSFGFWFYSGVVEVYIIPLFFLLLSFTLTFRVLQNPNLKVFAAIGITSALAILFHQMNILFAAVVIVAILINRQLPSIKDKLKAMAGYFVCLLLPVAIAYGLAIAFTVHPASLKEVYYWFTDYFHIGAWGSVEVRSPVKALAGFSNAFIGGHFLLSLPPLSELILSFFSTKFLFSYQFLTQHFSLLKSIILLIGCIPLVITFIGSIISYIRSGKTIWKEYSNILVLSLSWLVPYAIFVLWWEPGNLEFWIAALVPVWIIISLPFFSLKAPVAGYRSYVLKFILPLTVVCMFGVNLFGSMLPLHSSEHDYYFHRSQWYSDNTEQDDLIICSRKWLWGHYLMRNTDADVVGLAELLQKYKSTEGMVGDIIDQKISQVLDTGGNVYITSDSIEPETVTLKSFGLSKADFTSLWEDYQQSWDIIRIDDSNIVCVLRTVDQDK